MSHLELSDDVDQGDVVCTQPQSMGASQTNAVTTRVGRHVKPPNRLICEISTQKVEDVSPSGSVMNLFKCMFVA